MQQNYSPNTVLPHFRDGWNYGNVSTELRAIQRLKAVEKAYIANDGLHVFTKAWTLRHAGAIFPLRRLEILIPFTRSNAQFRYVMGNGLRHPVLPIYHGRWSGGGCIGTYASDYAHARERGALDTVIVLLGMVQTIRTESGYKRRSNRIGFPEILIPALMLGWVGFMFSLFFIGT